MEDGNLLDSESAESDKHLEASYLSQASRHVFAKEYTIAQLAPAFV